MAIDGERFSDTWGVDLFWGKEIISKKGMSH